MLGYRLIHKDELKKYKKAYVIMDAVFQCRRWFSGWRDLDIIWDYLLKPQTSTIEATREQYAKARHTDIYGDSPS